ncbi:hypothetical protein [Paeniglutamicibacter psychrophenolicus]|uniref:hypothetical protein n=1 Tax=Paeniglutamicibacter psychrophenolicus TaxID=257454 RepID=UPI0027881DD4|nr:hypothetical protein [Paeniglutamicibacter psychrophenolicus]MDQ0093858.1 hypothetical protein [Paeniglutamicibacter psychrophenolicus]
MGAWVRIGTAAMLLCALGGCAAGPLASSRASPTEALQDLMDLVPGEAHVLMGMGSADRAKVKATAALGRYEGTRLTLMAVCAGSGTLHLELEDNNVLAVPCDRKVATADVFVTGTARPGFVSIALEPGNTYSTLVFASVRGQDS